MRTPGQTVVLHHIPGRLRLRLTNLTGAEVGRMRGHLMSRPGIHSVSANIFTGSVRIEYHTRMICAAEILALTGSPD